MYCPTSHTICMSIKNPKSIRISTLLASFSAVYTRSHELDHDKWPSWRGHERAKSQTAFHFDTVLGWYNPWHETSSSPSWEELLSQHHDPIPHCPFPLLLPSSGVEPEYPQFLRLPPSFAPAALTIFLGPSSSSLSRAHHAWCLSEPEAPAPLHLVRSAFVFINHSQEHNKTRNISIVCCTDKKDTNFDQVHHHGLNTLLLSHTQVASIRETRTVRAVESYNGHSDGSLPPSSLSASQITASESLSPNIHTAQTPL